MDEEKHEMADDWALILCGSLAIVFAVFGFFGNLLTILALPYSLRLRNAATYIVVNLAVAEGAFCVTILPMSAAQLFTLYTTSGQKPLFDMGGCSVFAFIRYVFVNAELLSIATIAVNRCVLIGSPKRYPKVFTTTKTILMISAIWVFSIFLMIFPLIKIFGEFGYNLDTHECDFYDGLKPRDDIPRKVFILIGFFLPCVVVIVSYSYIFYKARQSTARVRGDGTNGGPEARSTRPAEGLSRREIRIARTIGVIFLAFLVLCLPVAGVHYYYKQLRAPNLLLLLHPVYWVQYCLNIFIYVFMNRQYRDAYVNYISRFYPNFREMSRRTFSWKEATSDSGRRGSRSTTPNLMVKYSTRKLSKIEQGSGPATPILPLKSDSVSTRI